jgi:hypothetical protein
MRHYAAVELMGMALFGVYVAIVPSTCRHPLDFARQFLAAKHCPPLNDQSDPDEEILVSRGQDTVKISFVTGDFAISKLNELFRPSVQQWLSLDLLTTKNRVSRSLTEQWKHSFSRLLIDTMQLIDGQLMVFLFPMLNGLPEKSFMTI